MKISHQINSNERVGSFQTIEMLNESIDTIETSNSMPSFQ